MPSCRHRRQGSDDLPDTGMPGPADRLKETTDVHDPQA